MKFINSGAIQKIKDLKETIDKYCTVIMGCLWTISTLWDIVTFQCFWSDYMLELYSCFFIIFMVLYIIFPLKVPNYIKKNFGIITTTLGRGIIMIFFALIFLCDKHIFHKLCSIFLLIGGICLLCLGLLLPETNKNIENNYNISVSNTTQEGDKKANNGELPETKIDDSTPRNDTLDINH